jgi:hypothetical protein
MNREKKEKTSSRGFIYAGIYINSEAACNNGRIDDFAVVESRPDIIYAGTASGGLWKTINNGVTWEPIFDGETSSSIGSSSPGTAAKIGRRHLTCPRRPTGTSSSRG